MAERRRVILDIEEAADPIAGRVGPEGGPTRAFIGWIQLIAGVEAARSVELVRPSARRSRLQHDSGEER